MEIQNIEMKSSNEELHAMGNGMPKLERKVSNLEAKKEILMKANVEMKSTLEKVDRNILPSYCLYNPR